MGSLSHGCSFSLPTIKLCWLQDVNPWDSYFPGWISCHKVKLSLQSSAQLSHLLRVLRKETQQCFVHTKPFLQLFFDMCLYSFCFGGKTQVWQKNYSMQVVPYAIPKKTCLERSDLWDCLHMPEKVVEHLQSNRSSENFTCSKGAPVPQLCLPFPASSRVGCASLATSPVLLLAAEAVQAAAESGEVVVSPVGV